MATMIQNQSAATLSDSTLSVTLDSAPTVGNLLVIHYFHGADEAVSPPTGFITLHDYGNTSGTSEGRMFLFGRVVESGDTAGPYTVDTGLTTYRMIAIEEWEGLTANVLDTASEGDFLDGVLARSSGTTPGAASDGHAFALFGHLYESQSGISYTNGFSTTTTVTPGDHARLRVAAADAPATTPMETTVSWTSPSVRTIGMIVVLEGSGAGTGPAASTLSDDFNDNSLDTTKWIAGTSGTATILEQNQRIEAVAGAAEEAYLSSVDAYSLIGSQIAIEVPLASAAANTATNFILQLDLDNSISIRIGPTGIAARKVVATVGTTMGEIPYVFASHRFLRMREAAGTTYWETSSTGLDGSWAVLHSEANPIDLSNLVLTFGVNAFTGGTATAYFDNVNEIPVVVAGQVVVTIPVTSDGA